MKKYAVIGDPVIHSLSPLIYNSLFEIYGIDAHFEAITVKKGELDRNMLMSLDGFACTMPHKQDIIKMLDYVDKNAECISSVNIVKNDNGVFNGFSTDGQGFVKGAESCGCDFKNKNVLLLGCGGAARAVVKSISDAGAKDIYLWARDKIKADKFICELKCKALDNLKIWTNDIKCDILINATPLGMKYHDDFNDFSLLNNMNYGGFVCDMVYNPRDTKLLNEAGKRGFNKMGGIDMLLNQAYPAFEIWTGISVTEQVKHRIKEIIK